MMKCLVLGFAIIAGTLASFGQELKRVTIEEATPGAKEYWSIVPQTLRSIGVVPEGVLLYEEEGIFLQNMKEKKKLISWDVLGNNGAMYYHAPQTLGGWIGDEYLLYNYQEGRVLSKYTVDTSVWSTQVVSPDGSYMMLSDGKNLGITTPSGEPKQLTTDGSHDITYGVAVHRNEFGIEGGIYISPDSRFVAFYRNDQSGIEDYPIVQINDKIALHKPLKYPMAGRNSDQVTIGIYDRQNGSIKYLETGAPTDRFFTNIAWTPDSRKLVIDEVERNQEVTNLREYDVMTGKLTNTLLTESNPRYIEPSTPVHFLSDGRFIRLSRVDGYNHLYLYSRNGKLIKQITKGDWEVKTIMTIVEGKNPTIYFVSNKDYLIGQDLYRVSLKKLKVERLTVGNGWHNVMVSPDAGLMLDHFSNLNTPNVVTLKSLSDGKVKELLRADNPLKEYDTPAVELGSLKSNNGDDLYYKLTRPKHIEPGKKYPVVLYVYGGPHSQLVTDSWRSLNMGWDTYMAGKGYVVFTIDNRGTSHRGMAFESITHRQLGTVEMQDQMTGMEYVKSLPYVDTNRIGVYGWSFGGFMTTNLMLTHPETFKVGVAGGPVMDWEYYEVMYGERYMDTPAENPEGYAKNNLIKRAADLKGRLLLIHGGVDPVVLWQHSQLFLQSAVKARTLPDYMVYPTDKHNVIGPDRVHLHKVICRYFDDHL